MTRRGQRLRRVWQSAEERGFGNLLRHDGLRRMNGRSLAGVHKPLVPTAVAHNLKKSCFATGFGNT